MDPSIFANLRNVLANLYPDEHSIRRIADDSGIDLSHIILKGHPKNDWHAILKEANNIDKLDILLRVVEEEYESNREFQHACNIYRRAATQLIYSPIALNWIRIAPGEFIMGLDMSEIAEVDDCEVPRHEIFLPEFWITRTPITVAQFDRFIRATGYETTAEIRGKSYISANGSTLAWIQGANWRRPYGPDSSTNQKEDHPVTCVSWYDAIKFCEWANVRLPSEAEWEKVARGTRGYIYPWGNDKPIHRLCNFNKNVRDTMPVDSSPDGASPYRVFDMAGNVWEWTRSLWGQDPRLPQFRYPYQKDDGREDMNTSASLLRVTRGGSWMSQAEVMRTTFRGRFDPTWPCNHIGFRVVWSPAS